MSEKENRYSVAALAERSLRCRKAAEAEEKAYSDSIKAWILSCCDRFRAMDPDIHAALTLANNMREMGLSGAMRDAGLAYDELYRSCFVNKVCLTYKWKTALHVYGFELDLCGTNKSTRLVCHYRSAEDVNPYVFFGDVLGTPETGKVGDYAGKLMVRDMITGGSREKLAKYMEEVDHAIDSWLPEFIQELCKFADNTLVNE